MNSLIEPSHSYIIFWIMSCTTLITFNKAILMDYGFPYPIFLTTVQMVVVTILTQILARTTSLFPSIRENSVDYKTVLMKAFPISLVQALSVALTNTSYICLSISYIQMLRAFSNVAVKLLTVMFNAHQRFLLHERIIVILTLTGIAMTSLGETNFVMSGFMYQLLANTFEGVRVFLSDLHMKELKMDPWSLLYYTAPMCSLMSGLACIVIEVPTMTDIQIEALVSTTLPWTLTLNGIIAFSVEISSILLIKHTSTLTRSLSLGFKNIYLITLSVIVFDTPVTMLQYMGYAITLFAILSQHNLRMIEAMTSIQIPTTNNVNPTYCYMATSFVQLACNAVWYSSSGSSSSSDDEVEDRVASYSKTLANSKEEKFESKQSQIFLI